MMYVTVAEVNALLGTSGEDGLIEALIDGAESLFNDLIQADKTNGLISATYTDRFPVGYTPNYAKEGLVFFLKNYHPTSMTTINAVSPGTLNTDFLLEGQRVEFALGVTPKTVFPFGWSIVYVAGYASNAVPKDIKLAIKYMVGGLYNQKSAQGISSFKQDLLTVSYKDGSTLDSITSSEHSSFIKTIITKYKVPFVIS